MNKYASPKTSSAVIRLSSEEGGPHIDDSDVKDFCIAPKLLALCGLEVLVSRLCIECEVDVCAIACFCTRTLGSVMQ